MKKPDITEIRKKPGMSNAGKYKNVPKKKFAGAHGTFPINTLARARNALSRAHFAPSPDSIKRKVYAKFPALKKRHEEKSKHSSKE
jgi:hypothetical protein